MLTVLFAEKGTNLRKEQEQAFVHFVDFLDECSSEFISLFVYYHLVCYIFIDGDVQCSAEHILIFLSGASSFPPLGFNKKPTLSFIHGILATSSTCDIQLRLPLEHGSDYSKFRDAMLLSIHGHDGFGGV